ncbi:MAG: branched-chain-amino-acid transaminase [Deltaproteobacteria bacterium RBG_13_65_10]|nr:MAG: branched-chain-amino-acid transaminase [Deltaproteobacteria bacterium RBG_13_65_10]
MQIYIDGAFYDRAHAKISVFDHGLLYGDGVFEGIRVYEGCVFRLHQHLERLYDSARAIALDIPMAPEVMSGIVVETVRLNGRPNAYVRLVVTRGEGDLGVDPVNCKHATVICIVDEVKLYPEEMYREGIQIVTASTRQVGGAVFDARIKSLNYLKNVLAKLEARRAGTLEAVMLNEQGYVAECTGDNIFIVKRRTLLTPPLWDGALDGITRGAILELAAKLSVPAREERLTRYDLFNADECFLTGTGAEMIPVVNIDNRRIGDGAQGVITARLIEAFQSIRTQDGVHVTF